MPKVGEPVAPKINFITDMYGFVEVNHAQYKQVPHNEFPPLVVRALDFQSLRNSVGGVEEYLRKTKNKRQGFITSLEVEVSSVSKWINHANS